MYLNKPNNTCVYTINCVFIIIYFVYYKSRGEKWKFQSPEQSSRLNSTKLQEVRRSTSKSHLMQRKVPGDNQKSQPSNMGWAHFVAYGLMTAVAVCTAMYTYYRSRQPEQDYQYGERDRYDDGDSHSYSSFPSGSTGCNEPKEGAPRRRRLNKRCAICLSEGGRAYKLLCGHEFHQQCIESWLVRNRSCPVCRADVSV